MNRTQLLAFMRARVYAVQATVSPDGSPQAAVVGIAVTDLFEIVFDTVETTRKAVNLSQNPKVAFVIGGWTPGDERTMQWEGIVDKPSGAVDADLLREVPERVDEAFLARPHLLEGSSDLDSLHGLRKNPVELQHRSGPQGLEDAIGLSFDA